jgi:hypothetical protein
MIRTRKLAPALLVLLLAMSVMAAQKYKPWTEWSKKDAEKILNDSAWGQTQTDTDTTEMTWSTASRPPGTMGQLNQATSVSFHIRFLSAKPIRQALARLAELDTSSNTPQQVQNARAFVDQKYDQSIVVAVSFESKDGRFSGPAFQAIGSAITNTLKNNTYLEVKGKRIFLQEYQAPTPGGIGAIFIFPRSVDGVPVVDPKGGEIRFWAEFPGRELTLNMRFKIANMTYDGVIEY